nr:MAG TPA: hypothetical protein [Caudoviricetes sp.]DAJ01285.1 MAG TPA: hypothetical protein [Caudoviricetes sp.]DAW31117.1 MAG TPA: hypothetical protein [Caudoviricetes sp.]
MRKLIERATTNQSNLSVRTYGEMDKSAKHPNYRVIR